MYFKDQTIKIHEGEKNELEQKIQDLKTKHLEDINTLKLESTQKQARKVNKRDIVHI